jgi:hypothetical protein
MATTDPEKLKKTLGIDSWRQLSKEHVIQFASALPQLDKEVAINIVRQFPNFKDLATSALAQLQKQSEKAAESGDKGQERMHESFMHTREVLADQLRKPDLSPEERFRILNDISDLIRNEAEGEERNRVYQGRLVNSLIVAAGVLATAAVAVLGGKGKIGKG